MVIKTVRGDQAGTTVRCLRPFTGIFRDGTPAERAQFKWWEIDKELAYPSGPAALCADRCLMLINPLADIQSEELCYANDGEVAK